jgi:hypothetical protein
MTYAMSRFQEPLPKLALLDAIREGARISTISGKLAALVQKKRKQKAAQAEAEILLKALIQKVDERDTSEEQETGSPIMKLLGKIIGKALKWGAKKIFKMVVKPIIRFAVRMAMNLVRTVLTAVMEYVIVPAIEFVVALAVANPVTAAIFAALAIGGGAYWVWNKFFREQAVEPPKKDVDLRGAAEPLQVGEGMPIPVATPVSAEYAVSRPASVKKMVAEEEAPSLSEYVTAPIESTKKLYSKLKKKFAGFGADEDAYIKEASKMYNIPEDILRGFIKMEAGWSGDMSPTGAIGAGQFIQSTWDGLANTDAGKKIGMTVIGKRFRTPEDPRRDKRINTLATGLLARNNALLLKKNGLPLTGENLYMMHNIGPGIIDVMLGKPASATTLKAMRQNGMLAGQSAAQFLVYQKGRFNVMYEEANASTVISPTDLKYKDGTAIASAAPTQVTKTPQQQQASLVPDSNPERTLVRGGGKTIIGAT